MPIRSVRDKIKIVDQRETKKKKRKTEKNNWEASYSDRVRELNDSVWSLS